MVVRAFLVLDARNSEFCAEDTEVKGMCFSFNDLISSEENREDK